MSPSKCWICGCKFFRKYPITTGVRNIYRGWNISTTRDFLFSLGAFPSPSTSLQPKLCQATSTTARQCITNHKVFVWQFGACYHSIHSSILEPGSLVKFNSYLLPSNILEHECFYIFTALSFFLYIQISYETKHIILKTSFNFLYRKKLLDPSGHCFWDTHEGWKSWGMTSRCISETNRLSQITKDTFKNAILFELRIFVLIFCNQFSVLPLINIESSFRNSTV